MAKPKGSSTFYTRRTMTREIAKALINEHGNMQCAAKAILARSWDSKYNRAPTLNAVRQWIQDAMEGGIAGQRADYRAIDPARERVVNQILNVIEEAGVPIDSLDHDNPVTTPKLKSGFHEVVTRGPKSSTIDPKTGKKTVTQGPPVVTRARSKSVVVTLNPKFKGPEWPVIAPAKPTVVKYAAPTVIIPKGLRVEVVHPDTQIGYQRILESAQYDQATGKESYKLLPIHDERAIDVALQLTAAIQPDGFTHLGDLLDLSEFSKYLQVEEFWRLTQRAIDYAGAFYLPAVRSAMGAPRKGKSKRYRLVDGNHDWRRLAVYVVKNARAAYGLRPSMADPSDWSQQDLTFPRLLNLKENGFEQCGMWPGSEAWLVEGRNGLVVTHDPKKKGFYQASVISGHTHHHNVESFTTRTPYGEQTFTHYEIGCLASLDRIESRGSIQRTRVPSDRGFVSGWVQGIAVIEIIESTGQHRVEFVPIQDGRAIFRGKEYTSELKAA